MELIIMKKYHELECIECDNTMFIENTENKRKIKCLHCGSVGEFNKICTITGNIDEKRKVNIKCGNCKNVDSVSLTLREQSTDLPTLECPECNAQKCYVYIQKVGSIEDQIGCAKDKLPLGASELINRAISGAGTLAGSGGTV